MTFSPLHNHFLIAMPTLADDVFHHAVIYLCEHTQEGATGIIINQPLELGLRDVLEKMDIQTDASLSNPPVLLGGPSHPERGFVLHENNKDWRSTFVIDNSIAVTTSRDVLESIATGETPLKNTLVALGYAGWEAGQLEEELANNLWLSVPATKKILFDTPYTDRWRSSAALLGIDINTISNFSGQA